MYESYTYISGYGNTSCRLEGPGGWGAGYKLYKNTWQADRPSLRQARPPLAQQSIYGNACMPDSTIVLVGETPMKPRRGHVLEYANKSNVPLIGTNNVKYESESDFNAHDVLLCIAQKSTVNNSQRDTSNENISESIPM